jgi:hypothetical protein
MSVPQSDQQTESKSTFERYEYKYKKREDEGLFTRLLWYSAGADAQILQMCPESDRVKYQGLGGIVFATALLAFFSGSYAFYIVFGPQGSDALTKSDVDYISVGLSAFFGVMWALIIYNLDRFIVSSSGKGDGTDNITLKEFGNSLPRLFMALIIGVCLSKPLEIRIMKTEIDTQLALEQQEEKKRQMAVREDEFTKQKDEIEAKRQGYRNDRSALEEKKLVLKRELDALNEKLIDETQGKTKSGFSGCGPTCRLLQGQIAEKEKKNQTSFTALDEQIIGINNDLERMDGEEGRIKKDRQKAEMESQKVAQGMDGLIKRIHIAEEVGGWVPLMLMLLFLAIELSPIFFKMMLQTSTYDYLAKNNKLMLLARYGIELLPPEQINNNEQVKVEPVFHEPKSKVYVEKARLIKEAELNQLAINHQSEQMKRNLKQG